MSKLEAVKFDDTSIVKSSEAISIALHFEAFILKNMKEHTEERKAALDKLRETLMWVNCAIAEDQRIRHYQDDIADQQAKAAYDEAIKKARKKASKKELLTRSEMAEQDLNRMLPNKSKKAGKK